MQSVSAPLSPHERSTAIKTVGGAGGPTGQHEALATGSDSPAPPAAAAANSTSELDPEDDAAVATPPTLEDAPPAVDEAAEEAFLSEARARGEAVPVRTARDLEEDAPPKTLPPLDELVNRIPAEVREVLEDLFRARFVTVKRFPRKALKPDARV